jgi:hypothetical protein
MRVRAFVLEISTGTLEVEASPRIGIAADGSWYFGARQYQQVKRDWYFPGGEIGIRTGPNSAHLHTGRIYNSPPLLCNTVSLSLYILDQLHLALGSASPHRHLFSLILIMAPFQDSLKLRSALDGQKPGIGFWLTYVLSDPLHADPCRGYLGKRRSRLTTQLPAQPHLQDHPRWRRLQLGLGRCRTRSDH